MRVVKNQTEFPALLKDKEGRILAEGCASVSEEDRSVDFKSDFVPLHPMGTPLHVVRMFDGKEIHLFMGDVYLSDKSLLRLVNVEDILMPGSENVYCTAISIPATLMEMTSAGEEPQRFSLFRRKKAEPQETSKTYAVVVSAISSMRIEFCSDILLEEGDRFYVDLDTPEPLRHIPAYISKVYAFGEGNDYLCDFESMDPELRTKLVKMVRELNEANNKFF